MDRGVDECKCRRRGWREAVSPMRRNESRVGVERQDSMKGAADLREEELLNPSAARLLVVQGGN